METRFALRFGVVKIIDADENEFTTLKQTNQVKTNQVKTNRT